MDQPASCIGSRMKLDAWFRLAKGAFLLDAGLTMDLTGVVALFGPSGSGKTTFLRCLAGLERADAGWLRFGEKVWQDVNKACFLAPHLRSVGVVFQDGRLFEHLTVAGNLEYGWQRIPLKRRKITMEEVVELLELSPMLHRWPHGLSGGERQRVALGRALLTTPDLLLLDEPLASLDQAGKGKILNFMRRLQRRYGLPMLYVTHDMSEVVELADHLAWMTHGRIHAVGPLAEMVTRLDLPLAHVQDAGAVIEAVITGRDEAFHLTCLTFGSGQLIWMPGDRGDMGERVRIWVNARDVSLVLDWPGQTSILNIFQARVVELVEENPAWFMVKLEVGGVFLLARVTRRSIHLLGVSVGVSLFVQVKSVALAR
ncbi:MAG: molybdenum ABC transporter ATP-binding protein [Magnetococcus sp. YQC-5]